jgi:hypothetical protein
MFGTHPMERLVMGYDRKPQMPPELARIMARVLDSADQPSAQTAAPPAIPAQVTDGFNPVFSELAKDPANADLITALTDLRQRIEDRLAASEETRLECLRTQNAELWSKCRAKLDEVNRLRSEYNQLNGRLNAVTEKVSQAMQKVRDAEAAKPSASEYPTRAEIEQWVQSVNEARVEFAPHKEHQQAVAADLSRVGLEFAAARHDLRQLQDQQEQLQAKFEGRMPPDPGEAFGLRPK